MAWGDLAGAISGAAARAAPPPAPYHPSLAPAGGGGYGGAPVTYSGGGNYSTGGLAAPGAAPASTDISATPYAWMLSIPDVSKVLNEWQAGGHTDDWLKARIMATPWYRTTSETARNFGQLIAQDPATATQQAQSSTQSVIAKAQQMGVTLDMGSAMDIGDHILRYGWNDAQVQDEIMRRYSFHQGMGGTAGQATQQLKALAAQYLVPLGDYNLSGMVGAITRGAATPEVYTNQIQQMAKSMFPALSAQIDQGFTTRQIVDPYAQIASKELGIDPTAVDFTQPKWQKAINQVDPKSGQRVMMNLSDWTTEIHKNPIYGWDQTPQARQQAADLEGQLLKQFGMV